MLNMGRFFRRIARAPIAIPIMASAFLSGCVKTDMVVPGYEDRPSEIKFNVIDARPEKDKETEWLSLMITSCDYGIRRMGDEATFPSRFVILRQDIEKSLGHRVENTSITITRYRMLLNRSRQLLAGNPSNGSLIADILEPTCTKEKTTEGWYEASEITTFNSPIIVEINANFLGKDYAVRTVYSPDVELLGGGFRNEDQAPAIYSALEKANVALIEQLQRQ